MPGQIPVSATYTPPEGSAHESFTKVFWINEIAYLDITRYPGPPRALPRSFGWLCRQLRGAMRARNLAPPAYIKYDEVTLTKVDKPKH